MFPSFLRALLPGVANEPIATEPASPRVTTMPLWCDTDCGLDDALALVLAAGSTSTTMVAVSTVHGNTSITNVNRNVLRVLTACGKDHVPVYEGAPEPLLCKPVEHEPWDGSDGFGDAPEVWPTMADVKAHLAPGSAAVKLVECAKQHQGQLQVLALGPLTNLALAVKLDPELPSRIRRLVIMGGANGPGNMSPHAEFNFFCDPEAAKVVMAKFSNVVLVPMDVGATHPLPWPRLEGILAKPSLLAAFLAGITASSAQAAKATGTSGFVTFDPHAAVVAVCPAAIQASLPVYCDVELQGEYTRGMSVLDWGGVLNRPANVQVVQRLNCNQLLDLLDQATKEQEE